MTANIMQRPEFTILRIKRKRDEDVPEVLVVDQTTKKGSKRRKSGVDVFQRAETVDVDAWKDMEEDELRSRISELSKAPAHNSPKSSPKLDVDAMSTTSDMISRQSSSSTQARQYRVVSHEAREYRTSRQSRSPTAPSVSPKVYSSKELAASSSLRVLDAVPDSDATEVEVNPEMEKFQSLLQDYLKVSEPTSARSAVRPSETDAAMSGGDYVYDIFYQRSSTLSELADAANMATLTGFPANYDDDDYESESEIEDEADEDSNAEDFYRNDYPDDEEPSDYDSEDGNDMFHESSEDDMVADERFSPYD